MLSKKSVFFILLVTGILVVLGCEALLGPADDENTITIISVTPDSGLVTDTETDFVVTIEYELTSNDSGEVNIGFNSVEADRYHLIEEAAALITRGTGEHQFNVSVVVKDWGEDGDFKVYVNLSEHPHAAYWYPLDEDTYVLTF